MERKSCRSSPNLECLDLPFEQTYRRLCVLQMDTIRELNSSRKSRNISSQYFARLNKYIFDKGEKPKPKNHPFMNTGSLWTGGVIAAPPEDAWDSLKERANDVDSGFVLSDNEIVTSPELFAFFLDVDFKTRGFLPSMQDIISLTNICQSSVRNAFKSDTKVDVKVTLLLSTPKPVWDEEDDKTAVKMGFHIIFPNVLVRSTQAHHLCDLVESSVARELPKFIGSIDKGPYKSSGSNLRPAWSHKRGTCVSCHGIESEDCHVCSGSGRSFDPSVYVPMFMFDSSGAQLEIKRLSTYLRLRASTIRSAPGTRLTTGYIVEPVECDEKSKTGKHGAKFKAEQKSLASRYSHPDIKEMDPTTLSQLFAHLNNTLQSIPLYKNCAVQKMSSNGKMMFIDIIGDNSQHCVIKGKGESRVNHRSNRVFLCLHLKSMCLGFYCYDSECKKERKNYKKACTLQIEHSSKVEIMKLLGLKGIPGEAGGKRVNRHFVKRPNFIPPENKTLNSSSVDKKKRHLIEVLKANQLALKSRMEKANKRQKC